MEENKLKNSINNSPDAIDKMASFSNGGDLSSYLRSQGIEIEESEAHKLLCLIWKYKAKKLEDKTSGGVSLHSPSFENLLEKISTDLHQYFLDELD